jgi:integrase/recombinase XerC
MDFASMFLDYLRYEKRGSVHTFTAYKTDLEQFDAFLSSKNCSVEQAMHRDIRNWLAVLLEKEKNTKRTINRKISTLKAFYKFLIREKCLETNPMDKIIMPKQSHRLTAFVSEQDMEKLFEQLEFPDNFEGKRDRMILELFYATGVRLAELIQIKKSDLDFYSSTIRIFGKRKKERIVPMPPKIRTQLQDYIKFLEKNFNFVNYNENIFVTNKGEPVYPKLIYRTVRKYLDAVTTIDKRSPHVMRHTFATHLLDNDADLLAIKELLGHSSLAATQVYTHTSIEKIKQTYKQAHPRA